MKNKMKENLEFFIGCTAILSVLASIFISISAFNRYGILAATLTFIIHNLVVFFLLYLLQKFTLKGK
jgi:hypothetical protein